MKFVKGFSIVLLAFFINGCASYIANEIMAPQKLIVSGNWTSEKAFCDDNFHCIRALGIDKIKNKKIDMMTFNFYINNNQQFWQYQKIKDQNNVSKPLDKQLIFVFAGYNESTDLLFIYQSWLQDMTGAEVFVIPSANKSEKFKFGLNFVAPIVTEIKRRHPEKVHLVGFSMGAVAAQAVAEKIENAQLYLIAPMTDFDHSTKALWKIFYSKKFYAKLISTNELENAVQIVYDKSKTSAEDINIVNKAKKSNTPTHVFTSNQDRIALSSDWNKSQGENITLNQYEQLNHFEMAALLNQNLLADFTSQLLGRKVSVDEKDIIGILCKVEDKVCLSQMKE